MIFFILILNHSIYFFCFYIILLQTFFICFFNPNNPLRLGLNSMTLEIRIVLTLINTSRVDGLIIPNLSKTIMRLNSKQVVISFNWVIIRLIESICSFTFVDDYVTIFGLTINFALKFLSVFLFFKKLIPRFISKLDESDNSFSFGILSIDFLLLFDDGLFLLLILFIVSMVEFIHLMRCSMRIVPYELFWFVEIFSFGDLFLDWVGRVRQHWLHVMTIDGWLIKVFHFGDRTKNKIIYGLLN